MVDGLIAEIEKRARLMGTMLERFGIDIEDATRRGSGCQFAQAVTRCRGCSETDACEHYLASNSAGAAEAPPPFCPNAGFIEALRP